MNHKKELLRGLWANPKDAPGPAERADTTARATESAAGCNTERRTLRVQVVLIYGFGYP